MSGHVWRRATTAAMLLLALGVVACRERDPREWTLRHSVQFAKETIERAGRHSEPSPRLVDVLATGATIVEYLGAHMPDDEGYDLIGFETEGPSARWIVVVRPAPDGSYEIQGYGDDLTRPLVSTTARAVAAPIGRAGSTRPPAHDPGCGAGGAVLYSPRSTEYGGDLGSTEVVKPESHAGVSAGPVNKSGLL